MLNIIYISFYIYSLIIPVYLKIENFFTNLISNMDKIKLTSKSIILKIFLHLFQKLAFKYVKLFIVSFFLIWTHTIENATNVCVREHAPWVSLICCRCVHDVDVNLGLRRELTVGNGHIEEQVLASLEREE